MYIIFQSHCPFQFPVYLVAKFKMSDTDQDESAVLGNEDSNFSNDFNVLVTRTQAYHKLNHKKVEEKRQTPKNSMHCSDILKCEKHHAVQNWSRENSECNECILFELDRLPNGRLPTCKKVI